VLATGNRAVIECDGSLRTTLNDVPVSVAQRISWKKATDDTEPMAGALVEGDAGRVSAMLAKIAAMPGPLLLTQSASTEQLERDPDGYCLNWLLEEVST
jgi:RHH-type proline utilization regulon transcriptional repressor/proline dehydrogenase/delta 1-pyrroline-5-carboxylate dehydrogenase